MANSSLTFTIRPKTSGRKVVIEMDAERFERLAAQFGFFQEEFLESLERAERGIAQGKTHRLRSLRDLRRK